jgi:diguanylate cyclase (GGDEF)-like protein
MKNPSLDSFPCIMIITDMQTNSVEYCNEYAVEVLGLDSNNIKEYGLFDLISKASSIFFESYIRPTIVSSGSCHEVQLSLMLNSKDKTPAVANVKLLESKIFWSIYIAVARDKLYQELITARENLENKTEELTLLTRIDPLTSLLNRRAAIDDFTKIIHQLHRNFVPVSFLLIDIDWFKKVNDTYGHERGDEILINLSTILKKVTRTSDVVARWGGEEFLVILYHSNLKNTEIFCDRLHREVNNIKLTEEKSLSISVGVSALKEDSINCSDVIEKHVKEADTALYKAKENGRNRTECFDDKDLY